MLAELFAAISVWSVVLFVAGIALIVLELNIPGFGIVGVLGIICLIVDIIITAENITQGLLLAAFFIVILVVLFIVFASFTSRGKFPRFLVLRDSTKKEDGFSAAGDNSCLIGKDGTAVSPLRPAGIAEIDGERMDVVSYGDFIGTGARVTVIEVTGNRIVVKETEKAVN
ncbi:MAG: serine protease [Clostridiales bacterium]|nr:serine protease [Clostridiales bacterium]